MSSNNNSTPYTVTVRGVSPDLREVASYLGEQQVGDITSGQLQELLEKMVALDPVLVAEVDPQMIIAARRGRFSAKPNLGKVLLQPAGELNADFTQLEPSDVPAWLDQAAVSTPASTDTAEAALIGGTSATTRKRRLALLFLLVSVATLAVSAYFTFQPTPLIPDSAFTPITDQVKLATLRQQVAGHFANEDGNSELIVRPDGQLRHVERNEPESAPDETVDTYELMTMTGTGAVLRAKELGPVIIQGPDTLVLNGDPHYRRQ